MKPLKFSPLILFITIMAISCKKYDDSLPAVQMISANPYTADSIMLSGNVTSIGADGIQYCGFSWSTQPSFPITQNQILLQGTNGKFSFAMPAQQDSTYYIKCFAANSFGYAVSSVFKYTVPVAGPDSAPCSLTNNLFTNNYVNVTVASLSYGSGGSNPTGMGSYGIQGSDLYATQVLNISFNKVPTNGIYTTDVNSSNFITLNSPTEVFVTINGYPLNSGQNVYIAQNKDGTTTVSFCSSIYVAYSSNFTVSAKITF